MGTLLAALMAVALGTGPQSYDPATEKQFLGPVDESREEKAGVVVSLRVDDEAFDVYIAPASFLRDLEFTLAKGDRITVLGSRVRSEGRPRIIAREVTKGSVRLILRDERGRPIWEARRP
jgi:hypothetical protein